MSLAVPKGDTLPDLSVRIMLRILAEEGIDAAPALAAAGLPRALPGVPEDIDAGQEFAFQHAFVELTGYRPDLWVRTGSAYHLASFGELGLALMTASSLDDYLTVNLNTRELDYSLADVRPVAPDAATIGLGIEAAAMPEALREFSIYRDLGATVTILRDLWGGRFPLHPIQVALSRPSNRDFTILGEPVLFNAESTALTWDRSHNQRPLRYGDPMLHGAYLESCRRRGRVRGVRDEHVDILRGFIGAGRGEHLTLAALAAEVGATERTLQRRLQDRGARFRDLVQEARRRAAIELLKGATPIAEIAWRLGYSDTTSFAHAFRRWTGVSPGAARRGGSTRPTA